MYVRPIPEEGQPELPRVGFGYLSRQISYMEPPKYQQCVFWGKEEKELYFEDDAMWKLGKTMSLLAVVIGTIVMGVVLCTCCVAFQLKTFEGLFWTCMFCFVAQALTFLAWGSDLCEEYECTWSSGTGMNITAAMLWIWAANMIKSFPEALAPAGRGRRKPIYSDVHDEDDPNGGVYDDEYDYDGEEGSFENGDEYYDDEYDDDDRDFRTCTYPGSGKLGGRIRLAAPACGMKPIVADYVSLTLSLSPFLQTTMRKDMKIKTMTMTMQTIPNMIRTKRIHSQYRTSETDGEGTMTWIPVPPILMAQPMINRASREAKNPRHFYNPTGMTIKRAASEELIEKSEISTYQHTLSTVILH
jgi:hypothetical protein